MIELDYLTIAFGGAIGAVLRYLVSRTINSLLPFSYIPLGTIIVNSVGSFFSFVFDVRRYRESSSL